METENKNWKWEQKNTPISGVIYIFFASSLLLPNNGYMTG